MSEREGMRGEESEIFFLGLSDGSHIPIKLMAFVKSDPLTKRHPL